MRWIALLTCGALSGPILAAECPIDRDLGQGLRLDPRLSLGPGMLGRNPPSLASLPQYFYGQTIDGSVEDEIHLVGSAEIRQLGSSVKADDIRINLVENELRAEGDVRLFREGEFYSGPTLRLKPSVMQGEFDSATYEFSAMNAWGNAKSVEFQKPKLTELMGVFFTTCPKDRPAWSLRSDRMIVDQIREVADTNQSVLAWGGIPILPLGDFSFSTTPRRRSGFLSPKYAASSDLGFEVTVPYYWNMAPNRDMTISPKVITRRGVQLTLEHRYLEPGYAGVIDYEILPSDQRAGNVDSNRSFARITHNGRLSKGVNFSVAAARASDDRYLSDFGGSLLAASQRTLPATVTATSSYQGWAVSATAQKFQLLRDPAAPILAPYDFAPRVVANRAAQAVEWPGLADYGLVDWQANFELTNFTHKTLAEGSRLVGVARAALPTYVGPFEVTPRLGLHATQFQRSSIGSATATQNVYQVGVSGGIYQNNVNSVKSYQRVVPTLSLDSKLTLERDTTWGDTPAIQTLEPRVFYVYTPYREQTNLPVFDTGPATSGLSQLFSDSVYSGHDRVADQNQFTLALTSRFLSNQTGEEKLSATVAQRHYVDSQRVTVPGETGRTDRESDVLGEVALRYSRYLKGSLSAQYTPKFSRWQAGTASLGYQPRPGQTFSLSYRYQKDTFDTVDAAFQAPIARNWYGVGRLNYSLQQNSVLNPGQNPGLVEGLIGAEYDGGCWVGRVVVQEFAASATKRPKKIFFQIELNGIGRVGTDPLSALKTSIPNYRMINQLSPLPSRFENFQ